jgi:LPS-assembly protein
VPSFSAIVDDGPGAPTTYVRADQIESQDQETVLLSGDAEVQRGDQRILANQIVYDQVENHLEATGDVRLENVQGDQFRTEQLFLELDQFIGYAGQGSYSLASNNARGDAQSIELAGKERVNLSKVRYTTCPPGRDDWFLKLGRLSLDKSRNLGVARHAVVRFKRVPIFYWPYLRFPISDQRQTGFLAPELGNSTKNGIEFGWPFYWNIAPNYDATITPRILSKRGLQTQTEFRYLGRPLQGQLDAEFLPNDDETRTDRWAVKYDHRQNLGRGWSGKVDYAKVSDDQYLDDFKNNLAITSLTSLPQDAWIDYTSRVWNFRARALAYQTIDPTIAPADEPYDRLPQLNLSARPPSPPGRPGFLFESEFNNFQRDESLTGERLGLRLSVDWPFRKSYGFIIPRVSVYNIDYGLDVDPPQDETPGVTVPAFSLDNGLVFERQGRFIQTLEPRLYYLYVPFKNQDDLPNFDTSLPTLTFDNLFRENRFIGGDRIGDTNQLTAALTTRLLGATDGVEHLRFSLGQIYYFEDREVNLTPGVVEMRDTSDLVAEIAGRFAEKWYGRATVQWNNDIRETERSDFFLQYQPAAEKIVNLRYSFQNLDFEQVDVSTLWPVSRRWTLAASSSYSLEDSRNLESYAGFQYRSCCWALRFFARRRLDSEEQQVNDVLLQFELTGLARLGDVPDSPLRQSVFAPSKGFGSGPALP